MRHQEALNKLIDEGVSPSIAQSMLEVAQEYRRFKITHIWDGKDAWGSEIDLYVSYVPESEFSFTQAGFKVEFKERKLY